MSGFKLLDDSSSPGAAKSVPAAPSADHALGLTVHAMPAPEQTLPTAEQRTGMGRWKMLMVFLVCAAPVVASYITYYVVRPEGRRNFGELITPQRPLPDARAVKLDGESIALPALRGQWLLVSVGAAACDKLCSEHLYLQRQMRESLGKEKDRLDWVWLLADDAPVPDALQPALKGATVLRLPPAVLNNWLAPAAGHQLSEHLYVVDPMGNWMMRFPAALNRNGAAQAKRDLERLLRASAFWDQPGREPNPKP